MFGDIKDLNLVPIFGMIFVGWLFYLKFREKQIKNLDEYDRKQLIKEALAKLNAIDYTILSLYYFEDLSLKEISKIVEKEKNYLKVLLQRARLKLYNGLSISLKKELKELI